MSKHYDCIVVGGGPGGSTVSTHLVQAGWKVLLLEKENFPRFRIGESLLPYSMPIFRKTGFAKELDSGKYIRKYGAQFVDYRFHKEIYFRFDGDVTDASEPFAYEVEREEFDADLLDYAKRQGVEVRQPETVTDIHFEPEQVRVQTNQGEYTAMYVADATGRMSFLGNKLKVRKQNADLNNIGIFAHFEGVKRREGREAGDIIIGILPDQSWSWTIPFQNGKTSVGIVTNAKNVDKSMSLDNYVEQRLQVSEVFRDRMANAKRVSEVRAYSNYSHTCETIVGERWIAIGDAGIFLDPIFSSGVHLSMSGATFAADIMQKASKSKLPLNHADYQYENLVRKGVKRFHWIIRMFYDTDFVAAMERAMSLPHMKQAFTAIVAGDVWNDENPVFKMSGL